MSLVCQCQRLFFFNCSDYNKNYVKGFKEDLARTLKKIVTESLINFVWC